ncbi:MAG: restriction endonuclease subunit S [Gallionella sp.]|nr:restriction endonuclease subunit S [Gallionella sp.]
MNMALRAGYKQTEVGVIPKDWDAKNMEQITIHIGDGLHGTPIYSPNGDYSFINGNNLDGGKIVVTTDTKSVDCSEFVKYRKPLSNRSILLSINGTIGNLALYDDEQIVLGKSAAYLNIRQEVCKNFVYHSLQTNIVRRQFFDGLTGSTIGNLGLATIRKTQIPLPPTNTEQRAIATVLSDVDALLAAQDRLIAKKRDIKQAAMQQLLTGKQRLPGFSGEWEVKTLGDLFTFSGGYSASRDQLSVEGHCYLHYGDIHGSSKTSIDTEIDYQDIPKLDIPLKQISAKSLLKDGDVVFVDASEDDEGTSKHVVVVNKRNLPFISGLHTIVAKSKTDELSHEFRHYCFQTPAIRQQFLFYAVGTKVSGISKTNIPKLTLPLPSVPEQAAIASILSDMDADLTALEQQRDKTHALKQGMMQALLTGRIRLV